MVNAADSASDISHGAYTDLTHGRRRVEETVTHLPDREVDTGFTSGFFIRNDISFCPGRVLLRWWLSPLFNELHTGCLHRENDMLTRGIAVKLY
jgi:hypothetical protein